MPDAVELMNTIKKAAVGAVEARKPVEVTFGTVTGTAPLQIITEQKLPLGMAQLTLSRNVTDYTVAMTMNHVTESSLTSHSHTLSGSTGTGGEPSHGHSFSGSTQEVNLAHTHNYVGKKTFTVHNGLVAAG